MRLSATPGWQPKVFLLDVDGVMTTGQFAYSAEGKQFKVFGPDDHDGLLLLKDRIEIRFVSGDRKGFDITRRRIVDDMHFPLDLVSTVRRVDWISELWNPSDVIYMGDGLVDLAVFRAVGYAICPADGFHLTRAAADFVTTHRGGERAVAEACVHVLQRWFCAPEPEGLVDLIQGGEWGKPGA